MPIEKSDRGDFAFEGIEEDNQCHICGRDMTNFTPREGIAVEKASGAPMDYYVDYQKGIGTCPEHGVSYSELSVKPPERGNCHCEKDDCPTCGD